MYRRHPRNYGCAILRRVAGCRADAVVTAPPTTTSGLRPSRPPVREIAGRQYTPGRITETLLRDYEALVRMAPEEVAKRAA